MKGGEPTKGGCCDSALRALCRSQQLPFVGSLGVRETNSLCLIWPSFEDRYYILACFLGGVHAQSQNCVSGIPVKLFLDVVAL